jgi:hypothetical protein
MDRRRASACEAQHPCRASGRMPDTASTQAANGRAADGAPVDTAGNGWRRHRYRLSCSGLRPARVTAKRWPAVKRRCGINTPRVIRGCPALDDCAFRTVAAPAEMAVCDHKHLQAQASEAHKPRASRAAWPPWPDGMRPTAPVDLVWPLSYMGCPQSAKHSFPGAIAPPLDS